MRTIFSEILHKLVVAVVGVAAGMTGYWYSLQHHWTLWSVGALAVAATIVIDVVLHPILWLMRHRRRTVVVHDTAEAVD